MGDEIKKNMNGIHNQFDGMVKVIQRWVMGVIQFLPTKSQHESMLKTQFTFQLFRLDDLRPMSFPMANNIKKVIYELNTLLTTIDIYYYIINVLILSK